MCKVYRGRACTRNYEIGGVMQYITDLGRYPHEAVMIRK